MRNLLLAAAAASLLATSASAQTTAVNAWVTEDFKLETVNWKIQAIDKGGLVVGSPVDGTAADLGTNQGATVTGAIDLTSLQGQEVRFVFYDDDTGYTASIQSIYWDGANLTYPPVSIDAGGVWDALVADYQLPGSFGEIVNQIYQVVTTLTNDADYAAPDNISATRTFAINGTKSTSIPQINRFTVGVVTLAVDCDNANTLNPGTTIASVAQATCTAQTDGTSIPTSDLRVQQNRRKANFSVDPIATAGLYDCAVQMITSDGQTLTVTGVLQVQ